MKKILIASTALLLIGAHGASAQEKTLTISVYGFPGRVQGAGL